MILPLESEPRPGSTLGERLLLAFSRAPDAPDHPATAEHWDERNALDLLRREFPEFDRHIAGRSVLDFGCGEGWQSLAMARAGAARVLGVDINASCLERARKRAQALGLSGQVSFRRALPDDGDDPFDVAISQNAFEHFPDPLGVLGRIARALAPGGAAFITFGPPWLAPYGGHQHFFTRLPWVNVLFPERTVMRVRSRYRHDGAERYADVEGGLNRMTVARFENLVRQSGLQLEWKRYRAVKGATFLQKVPGLRELLTNHVSCVLRRT